jgi:hypothetical protein
VGEARSICRSKAYKLTSALLFQVRLVLLPGFQKGRDIKASFMKRAGSSFGPKKGNLRRTKKNLKN